MKLINKFIVYLINKFLAKKEKDIIIRFKEDKIEIDKAAEIIKQADEEEENEKYSNQYW